MANNDDTLRPDDDLAAKGQSDDTDTEQPAEGPEGSIEPSADESEKWAQEKGRLINALGDKNKTIERIAKEKASLEKRVKAIETEGMSEAEKYRQAAEEAMEENFRLKMGSYAEQELKRTGLNDNPALDYVRTSPWAVPDIQEHLSNNPTWSETEEVVKAYLPGYLESLAEKLGNNQPAKTEVEVNPDDENLKEPTQAADAQRTVEEGGGRKKKVWSRREIAQLGEEDYKKHRKDILQAQAEGRIVD